MENRNLTSSPLKNLLNKPFSIGSPPYVAFTAGKVCIQSLFFVTKQ